MRFFVLGACLALASCSVFETPEVRVLRQANDADAGDPTDGGNPNACSTSATCGAGMVCVAGACVPSFDAGVFPDAGSGSCGSLSGGSGIECVGQAGMQLGWSVSLCDAETFAAGAPGGSTLLSYAHGDPAWFAVATPAEHAGQAVLCRPNASTLVAGPSGVFEVGLDGTVVKPWGFPAQALASFYDVLQQDAVPLATADVMTGGRAVLQLTPNGFVPAASGNAPWGASLATSPDGLPPIVAVGAPDPSGGGVVTLKRSSVTGTAFDLSNIASDLGASPHAGVALAIGNVWPDRLASTTPNNEVLVATATELRIYRGDLTFLGRYAFDNAIGSAAGAPVSVVVDDAPVFNGADVHVFYVGLPASNTVLRCLGTRCATWKVGPLPSSDFGASLSQAGGSLLVGAPSASAGRGAVYLYPRDQPNLSGELQECQDTMPCCTTASVLGVCVGGVFCQTTSTQPAMECIAPGDAGTPDAGAPDAGPEPDAGASDDAGTPDAGVTDAGVDGGAGSALLPAEFAARGCTSAPGAWLGLLTLVLRRRGRSRS